MATLRLCELFMISYIKQFRVSLLLCFVCLQCFDIVDWVSGRASGL